MTADKETLWLAEVCANHSCVEYRQSILDLLIAVIGNYGKIPDKSPFAFSVAIYLVSSYIEANLKAFITCISLVDLLFMCSPGDAQ